MAVFTHALSTNNYGPAKFIVSASAANGTHTTIASALAVASSGDTIFIRNGTYTENLTLVAGVNLSAFECDALSPNVTIKGTCTFTAAGTVSISGIRLQTNAAFALAITGSSASIVNLFGCYLDGVDNTIISFTSSSVSAFLLVTQCLGQLSTTGIAIFAHSSAGIMRMRYTNVLNPGLSTTANTVSAGFFLPNYVGITNPLTVSGTATMSGTFTSITCVDINATALTYTSSTAGTIYSLSLFSGSASALSIGTGSSFLTDFLSIQSSNTNAITGLGTLGYEAITFTGSSSGINTTIQTALPIVLGARKVVLPAGNYTVLSSDYFVGMDSTSAHTATLNATPATGQMHRIKDYTGTASSFNITISGNGKNIDGAGTYVIANNYGSVDLIYSGTSWAVV